MVQPDRGAPVRLRCRTDLLQSIGNLVRDPEFSAYFATQDFSRDLVMQGRESTASRPVKLSVQLYGYGEGRKLLLARDVTAVEQAEAMRRDFVANVSHEIRTPLTVLVGFVETLQNLPLEPEERNRYLGLMAQQAERMQHLVEDLLALSRLEGSPLPSSNEWVPVAQLMQRCENEARGLSSMLTRKQSLPHALSFRRPRCWRRPARWLAPAPSCKAPSPTCWPTLCATHRQAGASTSPGRPCPMDRHALPCRTPGQGSSPSTWHA